MYSDDMYGIMIALTQTGRGALYSDYPRPSLFYTENFGRAWQPYRLPGAKARDLAISNDGFGLLITNAGLARTVDFGKSWSIALQLGNALSVAVRGNIIAAFACGDGSVHFTQDGGKTWSDLRVGLDGCITKIRFVDRATAYLLVLQIIPDPSLTENVIRERAYENWQYRVALRMPGDAAGDWAAAERKLSTRTALVRCDISTGKCNVELAPDQFRIVDIDAHNNLIAVLASDQKIYSRQEGNTDWSLAKVAVPEYDGALEDLTLVSAETWLCSTGYNFARSTDAGANWKFVSKPGNIVCSTWFASEQRGFTTTGNYGGTFSVLETLDAGANWGVVYD